ncbi:MAG TPA: NAD(P)-dependent oxidoreductase, partial [Micromonosporaceae bacterium]|nr:NAD(P)-dependent oxidoreductase [Micromonosporaceae bacterium]
MSGLSCVSVAGCQVSLDLLETLAYGRDDLADRLPALRERSRASGLVMLSTCQRTEAYATWRAEPDDDALIAAVANDRGVPVAALRTAARTLHGDAAVRHLLRVTCGLESFALGEAEIAGQVRVAIEASRAAVSCDVALERLMDTAISASRRARRRTSIAVATRSVATVAVETIVRSFGGTVAGRHVLVVGAGQVAEVVVDRAIALGATVTVCNRTRRNAARFAAAGAEVVDLADLSACLGACDVAILATAAPHPLVDARGLTTARPAAVRPAAVRPAAVRPAAVRPAAARPAAARPNASGRLTLVDLSLPRNVDPDVRALPSVRLLDLADLRDEA